MEEKIPCTQCNDQLWEYIKPYLKEWGYKLNDSITSDYYFLVVINSNGKFGEVANVQFEAVTLCNRELVINVEEFLERAAKLKGFTYKRKDMKEEFDVNKLEVGMIVEYKSGERRVVLPDSEGNLFLSGTNWYKSTLSNFTGELEIYKVYKIKRISHLHSLLNNSDMLELIWEKPKEVELTMQEIADKFDIPVEWLRIKK